MAFKHQIHHSDGKDSLLFLHPFRKIYVLSYMDPFFLSFSFSLSGREEGKSVMLVFQTEHSLVLVLAHS